MSEIKYTLEAVNSNRIAVKCTTQEEWDTVKFLLNDGTTLPFNSKNWNCINRDGAAQLSYYAERDFTIIPASRFIADNQPASITGVVDVPSWQKDWDVLEFKGASGVATYSPRSELYYYENNDNGYPLKSFLRGCTILSIRRKSDGAVFTVGDLVIIGTGLKEKIAEIIIEGDEIMFQNGSVFLARYCQPYTEQADAHKFQWDEEKIKHLIFCVQIGAHGYNGIPDNVIDLFKEESNKRVPLFQTYDGKDVFLNDIVFSVDTDKVHFGYINDGVMVSNKQGGFEYFSTREAAEDFVRLNKPCLSIDSVLAIAAKHVRYSEAFISELKSLVTI